MFIGSFLREFFGNVFKICLDCDELMEEYEYWFVYLCGCFILYCKVMRGYLLLGEKEG